jgi:hypothetical protein
MRTAYILISLALVGALVGTADSQMVARETSLQPCAFTPEPVSEQATAAYQIEASFEVKSSKAEKITVLADRAKLRIEDQVRSCIGDWRLGVIPDGVTVQALFQYFSSEGWVFAELTWPGHRLRVSGLRRY